MSFYCPNCSNNFDISKFISKVQSGGDIVKSIIEKIINKETINNSDLKVINLDKLTKHSFYKNLSKQDKEFVLNTIKDKVPTKESKQQVKNIRTAYFKCTNCGFNQTISPGTRLISKGQDNSSFDNTVFTTNYRHHSFLPRTRAYICKNNNCESHTNFEKREAVMHRIKDTHQVRYVCVTCNTGWLN